MEYGPLWSRDGRSLFYSTDDGRTVGAGSPPFDASGRWDDAKTEPLCTTSSDMAGFDVLPDGQTFVVIQTTPGPFDNLFHIIWAGTNPGGRRPDDDIAKSLRRLLRHR